VEGVVIWNSTMVLDITVNVTTGENLLFLCVCVCVRERHFECVYVLPYMQNGTCGRCSKMEEYDGSGHHCQRDCRGKSRFVFVCVCNIESFFLCVREGQCVRGGVGITMYVE